ncbi:uncharacterized protein LOC144624599 [Crassostrea virginica]
MANSIESEKVKSVFVTSCRVNRVSIIGENPVRIFAVKEKELCDCLFYNYTFTEPFNIWKTVPIKLKVETPRIPRKAETISNESKVSEQTRPVKVTSTRTPAKLLSEPFNIWKTVPIKLKVETPRIPRKAETISNESKVSEQTRPVKVTSTRTPAKLHSGISSTILVPRKVEKILNESEVSGVLAWAAVTTIAIILLVVKKLLRSGCKCTCVRRRRYRNPSDVENPTSDSQTLPPAQRHSGSFETIAIHLHTPPSQATTPSSSSPSTPDTIVRALQLLPAAEFNTLVDTPSSVAPLITHEPVAANTRAKVKAKRKLL